MGRQYLICCSAYIGCLDGDIGGVVIHNLRHEADIDWYAHFTYLVRPL
jgi:hypothetical protein